MKTEVANKSKALLTFLKETATLRRKPMPAYAPGDRVLWFCEVPSDRPECRSPFRAGNPQEQSDVWLEVRKGRLPVRPQIPELAADWVRPQDLDDTDRGPELLPEITVLVERKFPDPEATADAGRTVIEKFPEVRRLQDRPDVEDAWLEYLVNRWEPWAEMMRRWREVQRVYEDVDFMRRRLEEAEERYELVMGVGLLQYRDSRGTTIKRHLLTAPADISLDAARGVLTVAPAASFEQFRIEVDMLELGRQPRLDQARLEEQLEELDVQAWDTGKVGEILHVIANRASPDAEVDEKRLEPLERAEESLRVVYAPALILRERRPAAYEELIGRFLEGSDGEPQFSLTQPWEHFLLEGEGSQFPAPKPPEEESQFGDEGCRLYFPRPANEEQRKIAERLQSRPYVLVKGPPGTGKSLTIANLICHLLAMGKRVLVTAQAPKALAVLRDKLPDDIRSLCVTALGSTRAEYRLLEDSVRGILARKNEWRGKKWSEEEIDGLERELNQLHGERARLDREFRECREAETHRHTLYGGYEGTAAQIARNVEEGRESYGWLPALADAEGQCPLGSGELEFVAEVNGSLSEERLSELRTEVGNFELPDPEMFGEAVKTLVNAEQNAKAVSEGFSADDLREFRHTPEVALEACNAFLNDLEQHAIRTHRALGDLADEVLKDLLVGRLEPWSRLAGVERELLKRMDALGEQVGTSRADVPAEMVRSSVLHDARRRLEHFRNGGRRGWRFLAPRVVRETRYVEERCKVDGQPAQGTASLETVIAFLELEELLDQFSQIWPVSAISHHGDPWVGAHVAADSVQELNSLLEFFEGRAAGLASLPTGERETLSQPAERHRWIRLIEAEISNRAARHAGHRLESWLAAIRGVAHGSSHPCIFELAQAAVERDSGKWRVAWEKRQALRAEKLHFDRYELLLGTLDSACAGLKCLVASGQGNPEWKRRLLDFDNAWAWAAARCWLSRVVEANAYERLGNERNRLAERIERKVEELASLRAWKAFFDRLDERTEQDLTAWTKAISRIGKGTGKYAQRHRRTARQYLMACIPKIPAWIMPLHKVWETTGTSPGAFDTVIVDEASQAGVDSLALLLLAKRVIVVGDDKQNSPEAVGVLEDDIARLANAHLREFRFRDEFRPDTSLFDHAERAFGNLIALREHFRCVPEIIRFSNDLCYTDAPLIPLRQPPPNRLRPLQATFVNDGSCEGSGQRIFNRAEAERIAQTVRECIENEAYDGKTIGVITLQGHAQAELIEKILAETLDPRVREERKLRCGVPATFQGDERDVMFLSLVVAPNHEYRALTTVSDQRRFNVAVSRARDQVWLFHSVEHSDLSREDLRWKLLHFVSSPGQAAHEGILGEIDRLEREAKRSPRRIGGQPDPYDSWFEVDVALELLRRKYRVQPQYDVAGYRIDLMVEGLENRLAVECDGDAWHGPERFEQDAARQLQLERAGLTFVRVRESEFYASRINAVRQVVEECERLGIRPSGGDEEAAPQDLPAGEDPVADPTDGTGDDGPSGHVGTAAQNLRGEGARSDDLGGFASQSQASGFPDPREASSANVRAALHQVIDKQGPLSKASIFRLYVEGCPGLYRAGKTVRSALNRALWAMQRAGDIIVEDELGDRSLEGQVIRVAGTPRIRERVAGRRDLQEIPPSELFLVLERLAASSDGLARDDETLSRVLLEHYGFTRLTESRRRYLTRVLRHWGRKS